MENLYIGRANESETKQLIATINEIFFADDPEETRAEFLRLLPKLYKDKYSPAYNNFIVRDGNEIKAAVGFYPMNVKAAGKDFLVAGIGNVGVTKDSRGKGYMKVCMKAALDEMINGDYDYSLLSGRRQRYGYFGYELAGSAYRYRISQMNIDYVCGKNTKSSMIAKEVSEDDIQTLTAVKAIKEKLPCHNVRKTEDLVDILKSWNSKFYAAFRNGEFKGYFAGGKNFCNEFGVVDPSDTTDLLVCMFETTDSSQLGITVPAFDTQLRKQLNDICEGCDKISVEKINILKYKKFIEAFLTIKAERLPLVNGTLVLLIHGMRADEQLEITVCNGKVSVCDTDKAPDIELDHIHAQQLICSDIFIGEELPPTANSWFPVDFHCNNQDNV